MIEDDTPHDVNRRRVRRYSLAVPIDIVALRSGVPASIPGRTVNVSEGGVATVLAGELSPGESVGLEFKLPLIRQAIQAKAIVRHYSLMQCGLQFQAMPAEQENALRTWTQIADRSVSSPTPSPNPPSQSAVEVPRPGDPDTKIRKRPHGARWLLVSAGVVIVVLTAVAWWSWNTGWRELESGAAASGAGSEALDISSSIMGQRIVHRVDPIYPAEAVKAKIEGQVMLEALIGEDGTVRDVYAVSGPDALRPAAVDAVRWWRFEPYRVSGKAKLVHTLIEVDFRLER